jgi:hypothetical protein
LFFSVFFILGGLFSTVPTLDQIQAENRFVEIPVSGSLMEEVGDNQQQQQRTKIQNEKTK